MIAILAGMMTPMIAVPLAGAQLAPAAEVLARAFFDGPMMLYVIPDDSGTPRRAVQGSV